MTDHNKAQVSALMDGELDEVAIKKVLEDRTTRQYWHRYHIISDIIQNRIPVNHDPQLSLRISELIRNEPAILAPTPRRLPDYLKPVAGIAVAASVATLAILGIQQYQGQGSIPEQLPVVASTGAPVLPVIPVPRINIQEAVVRAENVRPVQQTIQGPVFQRNPNNVQMSRYILNHNEYQSNAGVHGVTPHVRLVATDGR